MLVALGAVVSAASIVWGWVWGTNGPNQPREIDSLPQMVSFEQSGDATMTVLDLPIWLRALCATPGLVESLALAAAAFLLVGVLVAIGEGDSFSGLLTRHLRRIALVLVISSITVPLIDALAIWQVQAAIWEFGDAAFDAGVQYSAGYGESIPDVPWLALALGLVAAALGWAFQDGAKLERDVEGVV